MAEIPETLVELSVHPLYGDIRLQLDDAAVDRLWRSQQAAQLLAHLDVEGTHALGISADGPAAVAEFIADELADLLRGTREGGPL